MNLEDTNLYANTSRKINYKKLYELNHNPSAKRIAVGIQTGEITFEPVEEVKFPNQKCKNKWFPFKKDTNTLCRNCGKFTKQKFFVHHEDSDTDFLTEESRCCVCRASGHYTYLCRKCLKK